MSGDDERRNTLRRRRLYWQHAVGQRPAASDDLQSGAAGIGLESAGRHLCRARFRPGLRRNRRAERYEGASAGERDE